MAGVNCGGHVAATCAGCPGDNGPLWCNGMCQWVGGPWGSECVLRGPRGIPEVVPLPVEFQDNTFFEHYGPVYGGHMLLSALIMFVFAACYYKSVVRHLPTMVDVNIKSRRDLDLSACLWKPSTCAYVMFCSPLVAGKNYQTSGVCGFWTGCIFTFLGMYTPFYCVWVAIRAWLSTLVQMSIGQRSSCCWQLVLTLFCYPCDLGRESLEIDDEAGAEISCINNLMLQPKIIAEIDNAISFVAGPDAQSRMCTFNGRLCT